MLSSCVPVINEYNMAPTHETNSIFGFLPHVEKSFGALKPKLSTRTKIKRRSWVFHSHKKERLCISVSEKMSAIPTWRQSIRPVPSHTQWTRQSVFWQAVLCKQALPFRTTELSNIHCLVKVSVRNYDISRRHDGSSSAGKGGGISHLPLGPAPPGPDPWMERLQFGWIVCLWLTCFETGSGRQQKKKECLLSKSCADMFALK